MTWQVAITLQVIASSCMTLFTRRLTLSLKRVFFGVGLTSYIVIALAGCSYALLRLHSFPSLPAAHTWLFIAIEGICIPASWLVQYKLISYIGAGNAVIVGTLNTVCTATLGVLLFDDGISVSFLIGAVFIISSSLVALRIRPDTEHDSRVSMSRKLLLAASGAVLFAAGMAAEKAAINNLGVWSYATYGWGMQAVGAAILFILFGRHELTALEWKAIWNGALLGFITSIAGLLYIYALSKGALSKTIVAAGGKVALTLMLAALLLQERNAVLLRVCAFALSAVGLAFIL